MKWLTALFLSALFSAQQVFAEEISIAVGDWPPYLSEKLKHNGIMGHLIKDVFEAEGYDVEITFLPWARAYDEAKVGRLDMTGVWMHKPERENDFYYSDPVLNEQFVFFHLKSTNFKWTTLDDLVGLKIGGGVEYSYGPEFDAALQSGNLIIERVPSKIMNWRKLFSGRILIYPEEINVGYSSLRQHFHSDKSYLVTHHPKPLLNNLSYVLFPKSSARSQLHMQRFNSRLKKFRESGKYDRYFQGLQEGYYEDK
jgi:polar amino acid transport system substrate-binding protein